MFNIVRVNCIQIFFSHFSLKKHVGILQLLKFACCRLKAKNVFEVLSILLLSYFIVFVYMSSVYGKN